MDEAPGSTTGTESSDNGRRKTFRKLILRFADKTSMQGVGYIKSARLSCSRITWTLITIASLVAMAYHVGCIIAQYRSWPIQTDISLGFSNLELPDITICNLNPIRDSKIKSLNNAKKLQDFLAKTDQEVLDFFSFANKKIPDIPEGMSFEGDGDNGWPSSGSGQKPDDDYITDDYSIPDTDDEYMIPDTTDDYIIPEYTDTVGNADIFDDYVVHDNVNGYINPQTTGDDGILDSTDVHMIRKTTDDTKRAAPAVDSKVTNDMSKDPVGSFGTEHSNTSSPTSTKEEHETLPDKRRAHAGSASHTPTETPGIPAGSTPDAADEQEEMPEAVKFLADAFELLDDERKSEEQFKLAYMELSRQDRRDAGHQMEDMLVNCSIGGRTCNSSMFTLHQNADYGNCWTISGQQNIIVREAGPRGGLSLVLYLENYELVDRVTQGHGARLVIHTKGSLSVPRSEGIFISAGFQTDIGLREMKVNRRGPPYGVCNTGSVFGQHLKTSYTRQGCIQLCEVSQLLMSCGCYNVNDEELVGILLHTEHNYTNCKNNTELQCVMNVQREMVDVHERCACDNPCTMNFLKLKVYYEDLNYEVITEVPEITFYQFLSDIGGAVGLWIGLSLISVLEIIQLLIEMYDLAIHKSIEKSDKHKERVKLKKSMSTSDAGEEITQTGSAETSETPEHKPRLFRRIIAILTRGRTLGLRRRGNGYVDYEAAYEPVNVDKQID